MLLGETPASCRKSKSGNFVTVADSVEALVFSQPGLTELEIAKTLFASEGDLQRIHMICRRLIARRATDAARCWNDDGGHTIVGRWRAQPAV
jgi:hypothetical protein